MIGMPTAKAKLDRTNRLAVTVALAALTIPAIWYVISPGARYTAASDLIGYASAANIFLRGGNPYDSATVLDLQRQMGRNDPLPLIMWSPPWLFPCILPLAILPMPLTRPLWFLINAAILILSADWMWRSSQIAVPSRPTAWIMALAFVPAAITLDLGQISILLLAGMCLFLAALRHRQDFLAGAATFLIALKPHVLFPFWIVLLLWSVQQRRWRVLTGVFVGLTVPSLLSLIVDPPIYGNYLYALKSEYGPMRWKTASSGTLLRLAFPSSESWIQFLPTLAGVLLVSLLWWKHRHAFNWESNAVPIALLSTLTAAYCWTFDWVVLLPAAFSIFAAFAHRPRRHFPYLAALLVSQAFVVFVLSNTAHYPATFWFPAALGIIYILSDGTVQEGEIIAKAAARTSDGHPPH